MSKYEIPPISFGNYLRLTEMTPLEALAYRNISEETKTEIAFIATKLLASLQTHPYVSIHGDKWKERFQISKDADCLDSIAYIYATLGDTLGTRHKKNPDYDAPYPSLRIESFEKCYRIDLKERRSSFYGYLASAMRHNKKIYKWILTNPLESDPTNTTLIEKLAKDAASHEWGEVLWAATARTNYWEGISFLIDAKLPYQEKLDELFEIAEENNSKEWIVEFRNHTGI